MDNQKKPLEPALLRPIFPSRDYAFVDATGHQGNDFQITGDFWAHLDKLCKHFDEDGKFVAILDMNGQATRDLVVIGILFSKRGRPSAIITCVG